MAPPKEPPTTDPDSVPETLCVGKFNISFSNSGLATLTFTHVRPKVGPLIDNGQIAEENIVRARIVTTNENLVALRDLLNSVLQDAPHATAASGGSGKPN